MVRKSLCVLVLLTVAACAPSTETETEWRAAELRFLEEKKELPPGHPLQGTLLGNPVAEWRLAGVRTVPGEEGAKFLLWRCRLRDQTEEGEENSVFVVEGSIPMDRTLRPATCRMFCDNHSWATIKIRPGCCKCSLLDQDGVVLGSTTSPGLKLDE